MIERYPQSVEYAGQVYRVGDMVSSGEQIGRILNLYTFGVVPRVTRWARGTHEQPAARVQIYRTFDGQMRAIELYYGYTLDELQLLTPGEPVRQPQITPTDDQTESPTAAARRRRRSTA